MDRRKNKLVASHFPELGRSVQHSLSPIVADGEVIKTAYASPFGSPWSVLLSRHQVSRMETGFPSLPEPSPKVAAAILGLDNLKAFGNAIHMWAPSVRLRKPGCAGLLAIRTPKVFSPVVEDDHPSIMSQRRDGSSQSSCHNQSDPVSSFGSRYPVGQSRHFGRRPTSSGSAVQRPIKRNFALAQRARAVFLA